jgi:hypothetical protein
MTCAAVTASVAQVLADGFMRHPRGEAAVALGVGAAYQTQLGGENAQAGSWQSGEGRVVPLM